MKHIFWTLVAILILALPVVGQISNPSVIPSSPPSTCKAGVPLWSVFSTGTLYICNNGTPTAVSGGGGGNLSGTLTPGYLPLSITDTHTLGNSLADYGVTNTGAFTFPNPVKIGNPVSSFPVGTGVQSNYSTQTMWQGIFAKANWSMIGYAPFGFFADANIAQVGSTVEAAIGTSLLSQNRDTAPAIDVFTNVYSINPTGTMPYSTALYTYAEHDGAGTNSLMTGIYVDSNVKSAGSVTENVGLYLNEQTGSGASADYQIYSAGTANSYFHGPMQFDNITGHGTAGVVAIDASGNLSVGSAGSSGVNIPYGTAGGTANAQTLTTTPPVTSLSVGTTVTFIPSGSPSSGSPTLNVGSTGAKTIVKGGSTYPTALFTGANGDMNTAMYSTVTYDGTYWVLQNPAGLSGLYVGSSSVAIGPTGIPNPGSSAIQIGAGTNSASQDTVVGYAAEGSGVGGGSDSIFGYSSCTGSGGANACFGHNAGRNQGTSGTGNSIFGAEAGYGTGHNNSFTESGYFGYGASPSANSVVNQWLWGYQVTSSLSNYQQFGNSSITETAIAGVTLPVTIYSHAGTQLATCASGLQGGEATVSDATSLTPGTAYSVTAGAGSDTIRVQCTLTGSTYAWQTM